MLKSLNKSVVLMEQTKHNNSEMSYCVNQLNVTHLNMTHPTQVELGLDMHLKVFLTTEGQGGNLTFLVQELAGTRDWKSPFYYLYYDGGARPNALIFEPWKQLQGNFDQFLKPFPNEEADKNRKAVEDEMDGFFGGQRAILYQNVLNGTGSEPVNNVNELTIAEKPTVARKISKKGRFYSKSGRELLARHTRR
ncbi:hypothetical protein [Bradyrhizobium australiense]|uniref:Uncharacterized protein n=1 Tax=Bradyrhizobium australiense TaxID=2721161 RepID=A0A7Y4GWR3_9BRAD|nr:hypothetical protein [Bradyrhizobium australiense]NOJ43375.1 hypothetical protein [Bradyrhizobium australiense]